jgi:uncharacterized protein YggE
MKKIQLLVVLFFIYSLPVLSQQDRHIEVTGNAEMYIEPDEIVFNISIAEYWENEFKPVFDPTNKGEKIKILDIEKQLIQQLKAIGIKKDDIKSTDVGTVWRGKNEEVRMRKRFEISLEDFSLINRIISEINHYGIDYMKIGTLKNKEIYKHRKEVKKQALLAAKEKATYLVNTLDKNLGPIVSIKEIDTDSGFYPGLRTSNVAMESSPDSGGIDPEKKIKLRYEIIAKFEIAD